MAEHQYLINTALLGRTYLRIYWYDYEWKYKLLLLHFQVLPRRIYFVRSILDDSSYREHSIQL